MRNHQPTGSPVHPLTALQDSLLPSPASPSSPGRFHPCSALTQAMMEKKEKAMAARAASAPCEKPLVSVVLCHWFAKKQKATNHRKARKPAGGQGGV